MADDGDDFVFDEDGIYRERDLDQDFLDEDGIWRDDDDVDNKYLLGRYTLRTDSGLGTADPRSSISTLSKVPLVSYHREHFDDSLDLRYDDDFADHRRGSVTGGEKSLNISDLEASASIAGDYDFERVSLDTNAEVDFPELLNDRLSSGSSNQPADVGDLNDFDDLDGSRDSIGLFDRSLNVGGQGVSRQQRSGIRDSPNWTHNTRTRYSHSESSRHRPLPFQNLGDNRVSSQPRRTDCETLSQASYDRRNKQSIADYLLRGSGDDGVGGDNNSSHRYSGLSQLELGDEVGQLYGPGRGRQLTQDAPEVLSYHQRHSLMEFEQLEAALDVDGHSEKSADDQMDLIGAYLQGLKDQEEEEDTEYDDSYSNNREEAWRRRLQDVGPHDRGSPDNPESANMHRDTAERTNDGIAALSKKSDTQSRERGHGYMGRDVNERESVEQQGSHHSSQAEEKPGSVDKETMERRPSVERHGFLERRTSLEKNSSSEQQSIAETTEESDHDESLEFHMSQDVADEQPPIVNNAVDRERSQQKSPGGLAPSTNDHHQDSFENANKNVSLNDSVHFLENQQPPFDSISLSTLDMTDEVSEAANRTAQPFSEASGLLASKIPMLRSRSPSVSRPATPTRPWSRPPTPECASRCRQRQAEGRALPKTPQRNTSNSTEASLQRDTSEEMDDDGIYNRTHYSEEQESELDKATSLLFGQTDMADNPPTTPTTQVRTHQSAQRRTSTSTSSSRPGSRPTSARTQGQASTSKSVPLLQRSSSVEGVRTVAPATLKKDQRARGSAANMVAMGMLGSQPLRAIGRQVEAADRALQEAQQRQMNEETLKQLHQSYNTLLQKYAQAENTIDSLRIGATIPISVELTTTGGATGDGNGAATAAPSSETPKNPLPPCGKASLNNSMTGMRLLKPGHGSQPGSSRNLRSKSVGQLYQGQGDGSAGHVGQKKQFNELMASLRGEGDKLSLLAKTKSVEEKAHGLSALLSDACLSTTDQMQALQGVRDEHEALQQDFRDARVHRDYLVRTGELPPGTPAFDMDKSVEGELYKLGMTMDDLEQHVQENVKLRSSARVPFKADHSIDVGEMNSARREPAPTLPPNRPDSVGSFAGGPEEIDEQLHQLTKDYGQLMDRYRRLKGLKRTPQRDEEIVGLLKNLRRIYKKTPDHRKPALPLELESHYNPVKDHFLSSESDAPRGAPLAVPQGAALAMYSKDQETDSLPGFTESDLSIARHSKGILSDRKNSSDYTSTATDSTTRQKRQKRLTPRGSLATARYDSFDSVMSCRSPKSGSSAGARGGTVWYTTPPGGKRRNEREDKDSGYVGSEVSRKVANQGHEKDRFHSVGGSLRRSVRSVAKSDDMAGDVTQSTSDLSTVGRGVRPHRAGTRQGGTKPGEGVVAISESSKSRLKSGRAISSPSLAHQGQAGRTNDARRVTDVTQESDVTDSDASSHGSHTTNRSQPSVKSEQIQTLANEITKLRDQLRTRDNNQAVTSSPAVTSHPQQTSVLQPHPQPGEQQYVYLSSYPYQPGPQLQAGVPPVYLPQTAPAHTLVGHVTQPVTYAQTPQAAGCQFEQVPPAALRGRGSGGGARNYDSGRGHLSDGERKAVEGGRRRSRQREQERKQRLRDYYIPSQQPRASSPVVSPGQDGSGPGAFSHNAPDGVYSAPVYGMAQPPQYGTAQTPLYGTAPAPQYGTTPAPHYGTTTAPHYGTTPAPHYGTTPAPHYGTTPAPHYGTTPAPQYGTTPAPQYGTAPAPVYGTAPAGPPGGPSPPTYQQTRNSVCGMCGGGGQHSHGDYMYIPSVLPAQPAQPAQPVAAPGYMLVPASASVPQPQPQPAQSTTTYMPVQLVETPASSKVRYYVREYGGETGARPMRRSYSHGNVSRAGRKAKRAVLEEAVSDSESYGGDLNDSLDSALHTASQLKVISRRMKKTLKSELDQSLRSSLRTMAY